MVGAGFGTAPPSADSSKIRPREQDKHLFIQKDFAARGNRTRAAGLSPGEKLPQEKKMRTLAMILIRSPFYPRKRTNSRHLRRSALCQKRTLARLFDHVVGAGEKRF